MMQNNKGFSLLELIVAVTIFSIVGLALVGFIISSSNTFNRNNDEINLQYEQQLVVNQVRDLIMECGKGIYFDDDADLLTVYSSTKEGVGGTTTYPVSFIKLTGNQLILSTKDFEDVDSISLENADLSGSFAEDVTSFAVDLSKVDDGKVYFEITFVLNGKTRTVKENVALRNSLIVSNDATVIWEDNPEEVGSFIENVAISRGVVTFASGATDEIGKMGEAVEVLYTAKITANDYSTRNYAVKWSIAGLAGPQIDPPTGITISPNGSEAIVRVENTVSNETYFKLYATSLDDSTKFAELTVKVTDSGVYAESMTLKKGPIPPATDSGIDNTVVSEDGLTEIGNGYLGYVVVPTLKYTDDSTISNYEYFKWDVAVASQNPEEPETGNGEEEEASELIYDFNEQTGRLVLYTDANEKTITVTATAMERNFKGEEITASLEFNPSGIPEYDPGTTLQIGVAPDISRGGYQQVDLQIFNPPEGAEYTYKIQVEPYYDAESVQWDGSAANSDFSYLSFTEATEYKQNEKDKHERDLGRNTSINLACSTKLNWSYQFKAILSATATDQNGNVIASEPMTVMIPAVEVILTPTVNVPTDDRRILTSSILRYEDWYFDEIEITDPKARLCTTRRWFEVSFNHLEVDDEDWTSYDMEDSYIFRNQVGSPLNKNIVTHPKSTTMFEQRLTGFTVRLSDWERLANRPVFMNYTVTIKDNNGNSQSADTREFIIIYDFYPKNN